MLSRKKATIIFLILTLLLVSSFLIINGKQYYQVAKASTATPFFTVFLVATAIPCFVVGDPPVCTGGPLCYIKDTATCVLYSTVTGAPLIGAPSILIKNKALEKSGASGSYMIAGGLSPTAMDNGFIAGPKGCYGCN
ncbi:MAG: hypothetical protein NTW06_01545 [Candidatus Falkowbacteria bacterium]|nr:hypothetical protein [Candidatus Falkowbacteria bacterium]